MADFLDVLARDAKETINEGYYETSTHISTPSVSLKKGDSRKQIYPNNH